MSGSPFEFHVSRRARDRYTFDRSLFSFTGRFIVADFDAARRFAARMNEQRDLIRFPEQAVKAGQINAMGLIDEILHSIVALYREQHPRVLAWALDWLDAHLAPGEVDATLARFAQEFPPLKVYQGKISVANYLRGDHDGIPHRQILLEELLMLWLSNENLAFAPFRELFDDTELQHKTAYRPLITQLHAFFDQQPPFGPDRQNLVDMLRAPAIAVPHSLEGQLEYIHERWGALIGRYLYRLLSGLDLIREEERPVFAGPGPALVYDFAGLELEYERFTPDRAWMPNVVLIAKNTYVWLDQLSRQYGRAITRLDQIPDAELDRLARWGFTGLWLIGLWERSRASQTIKQLCGNPEAVASAYSVFDYCIADDLGGHAAYQNLRDRAWARGIRLASDMVPNHVGIDSPWVIEHPDWFIGQDHSPFPSYSFTGPDLSWDQRVGIYIEDHYYDRTDAAVVFKWRDHDSGRERYIFHGNDGTNMPWNDTAQLNYLDPQVRQAVIDKILDVAHMFPIIRFDAAMTLAKRHYRRLWFPEPGTGGAIPGRAAHGLTAEQFDALMPTEFWRDVVDRVAQKAPDTLLLAEAFWLMEGYFVRTLGMHRVYNSAFMNMLRDEKNADYRLVVRNTIEFDPRILERYVNFMNNPDEHTAIEQFGSGDKYLGICTMMVTMPGLPMFGHGQIEGLREKYGMEYRRAYWKEEPNTGLVQAHERYIFPLLRRRRLFAGSEGFLLYDLQTPEGHVNKDVFAYSNRLGDERCLVVYHNRYAQARGTIHTSVSYAVPVGEETVLVHKSLGEGLDLHDDPAAFCIFCDHVSGLEYIRSSQELHNRGLYLELEAYQRHVFLDFREVWHDDSHPYADLAAYLDGRGVPSVEKAMGEVLLQPIHVPFKELVGAAMFRSLFAARVLHADAQPDPLAIQRVRGAAARLVQAIAEAENSDSGADAVTDEIVRRLIAALRLPVLTDATWCTASPDCQAAVSLVNRYLGDDLGAWSTLFGWLFTHRLDRVANPAGDGRLSRSWIDEWQLGRFLATAFRDLGLDLAAAEYRVSLIRVLTSASQWFVDADGQPVSAHRALTSWLRDLEGQKVLRINRYQGVLWFNQESFDALLRWMLTISVVDATAQPDLPDTDVAAQIAVCYAIVEQLQRAAQASGFQVDRLLETVSEDLSGGPGPPRNI